MPSAFWLFRFAAGLSLVLEALAARFQPADESRPQPENRADQSPGDDAPEVYFEDRFGAVFDAAGEVGGLRLSDLELPVGEVGCALGGWADFAFG